MADRAPWACGAKLTPSWQLSPGATVARHESEVMRKSPGLAPANESPVIDRSRCPELLTVTVEDALSSPCGVVGKAVGAAGLTVATGTETATPSGVFAPGTK